ncbi:MFS transporter [Candidatus Woesearchaeota archaeon]|nr:MFS transporter [Candidatus Woesearchaeota archaeon]
MNIFEKDELKYLGVFYVERFIAHLLYFAPAFWVLQFQQYLSLFQIGLLFAVFSAASFVFEIPTGAIADVYGRKFSVIFGYILVGIAVYFLSFVQDFKWLLVIFLVWGFAQTFISGAKESWVVDNLHYWKKKNLVKEFFIKEQSIIFASLFFSGLLGAFVVSKQGLSSIWLFASLSYLITAGILFFVKEHKLTKEKKLTYRDVMLQSKRSLRYAVGHHTLLFIIFALFFVMFRDAFAGDLMWQPFLSNLGLPVFAFGFVFSISTLLGVLVPVFTKFLAKKFSRESHYLAFLIGAIILLDISVIFIQHYVVGLIVLFLAFTLLYMFMPVNQSFFHSFIPGKLRATVTSFSGMVVALAFVISSPLAGYLADVITPRYTIALGSIILLPALILYIKIKDTKKTN